VQSLDTEEMLILAGIADDNSVLDDSQCRRIFDLSGTVGKEVGAPETVQSSLSEAIARQQTQRMETISAKNGTWFDSEMEKLDHWADDRRTTLKGELDELDLAIKDTKKAARLAPNLPEKLELQRRLRTMEGKRDEAWRAYDAASRDIDRQKDSLLDEIGRRLSQKTACETLFTLRWRLE
jgi:hypothetical protein